MKNIFTFKKKTSLFSFDNLKNSLSNIISRFPLSILLIFIIDILFFIIIYEVFENDENITRATISLIITFFFSLWIYLNTDNLNYSKIKKNSFQIIPLLFWFFFFLWFNNLFQEFENLILFLLSLFWIISYLFFAPYLNKKEIKQEIYYSYFYSISLVFFKSFIIWWILFLLWNIWIQAVNVLFDLNLNEKIILDWAVISLSLITPIFALTQLPTKENFNKNTFKENLFFSFIIKYITIPFIYIYFIILYSYTIKVLINFTDWPKWEITWLVIWFSTFWYLIYIFSYIFESVNKSINIFRKWFPFAVIPQLFMLFYAIYLRINQYDLTINRYFVVIFWIWLLIISIYLIISKRKCLRFIPVLLTLFTIIISIWPWSVYKLPEIRQYSRLENDLIQANILQNWKIIPLKNFWDIDEKLSENIYSEIEYLCNFHNCKKIKILFEEIYIKAETENKINFQKNKQKDLENNITKNKEIIQEIEDRKYYPLSNWEIVYKITENIKVRNYFDKNNVNEYIFFNNNENIFPLDIKWYSEIIEIDNNDFKNVKKIYWKINLNENTINIIDNWQIIDTINLKEYLDKIYNNYKINKNTNLTKQELTLEIKNYKIIFIGITIKNQEYKWENTILDYWFNWYILVK